MKLQLLTLRAIRCGPLDDVCIDFCDSLGKPQPITVLAGANGCGKTTVLELICALCEVFDPQFDQIGSLLTARYYPEILRRTEYAQMDWLVDNEVFSVILGQQPADANIAPNYLRVDRPDQHGARTSSLSELTSPILMGTRAYNLQGALQKQKGASVGFPSSSQELPADSKLKWPSVIYFPYSRFLVHTEGKQIQREETRYQWVYRYEHASKFQGSLDSYLVWLDYAEPETFARVIEFLNALDFDGKTFSVVRKDLAAIVTTRSGRSHKVANLSSGEQNLLIMLLELRRRLLPHSIVLIDEIENSLHPAFQRRLSQSLKDLQATIPFQFVATTHAPAFIDIFGTDSIRIMTEF